MLSLLSAAMEMHQRCREVLRVPLFATVHLWRAVPSPSPFFSLSAVEMENVVGSIRAAKAGVEWRYQHSLLSTSPATGGSFIFPA